MRVAQHRGRAHAMPNQDNVVGSNLRAHSLDSAGEEVHGKLAVLGGIAFSVSGQIQSDHAILLF